MKRNVILISTAIVFSVLMWQCSENGNSVNPAANMSLKESLNGGVEKVNQAINAISQTEGYQVLMMNNGGSVKSTADNINFQDSITFNDVKGVYEFQPMETGFDMGHKMFRLFTKTGDSSLFVVRLPEEFAMHPHRLHDISFNDSTLNNNFVITASDYHYYFSMGFLYDYKLMAGIDVDSVNIGNLDIQSKRISSSDYNYNSKYSFDNGYNISTSMTSGDTVRSAFALSNDTTTLLKESTEYLPASTNSWHREKNYMLTVGNVEFRKYAGADSIQVYLNGNLQNNARIEFIDQTDSTEENSVIHNRDIQITFDDGTTAKFSEMISPSLDALGKLVDSMHDVYFATNLVNYIAWDIYKNSN